jgi:DNA-binding response OmpR family regulator
MGKIIILSFNDNEEDAYERIMDNIVMSHIRHIREKIEDNPGKPLYIQTVWGIGYRFNKNLSSSL